MEESGLVKETGLGIIMTTIFIAGQMAGGGVLMLPGAMVSTGPAGLALLIYFTVNGAFVGTRLGYCWIMVEERFPEYREKCRDPYPVIAEKAVGKVGRYFATACIISVSYGSGVGFLILMAKFMDNIFEFAGWSGDMTPCKWMAVWALIIMPLCWFGSPHDFWFVAPTALLATLTACLMIMFRESLDAKDDESCYFNNTGNGNFDPEYPSVNFVGFGEAFSLIMFAYSGSASFPTYQSDMKDRRDFPKAVLGAMTILFLIYLPMAATGYFELGDLARDDGGIVCALCEGGVKLAVEILLLIHLVSAYPMFMNPPNQFIEELLGIPATFNVKRTVFRSLIVALLLFLAESLPSFSAILQLVSSIFVTCLTFIFPPLFYIRLVGKSSDNKKWKQWSLVCLIA